MSRQFERKKRRKKFIRQALILLVFCFIIALGLVFVRGCSANMKPEYNDSYHPMDMHRIPSGSQL